MDSKITWDSLYYIISLIVLLGQGLFAWLMWSARKSFVPRETCDGRCGKNEDRMNKADLRMAQLETAHQAMPTPEDVSDIKDRLGGIEGEMKGLVATIRGQAEIMTRIERPLNLLMEHHLRGDNK